MAHISGFFTIKSYQNSIDKDLFKSYFKSKQNETKPLILAEVKTNMYFNNIIREMNLKAGGILNSLSTIIDLLPLLSKGMLQTSILNTFFYKVDS
jgi:hypothetical protein